MYKVNILPVPEQPGQYYATEPFEVPSPVVVNVDKQGVITFPEGIPSGFNIGYALGTSSQWKSFLDWTAHVIRMERPDLVSSDPLGVNYWARVRCGTQVELVTYRYIDVFDWSQVPVQGAVIMDPSTNRPDYTIDAKGNRHPWGHVVTTIPPVWYLSTHGTDPYQKQSPVQDTETPATAPVTMSLIQYILSVIRRWLRIT